MKSFRQIIEASVHPMAVHAYPSGKNEFTVHAVGSKVKHVSPGEKVTSSDLDDLSDAGHKVKEVKKPMNEDMTTGGTLNSTASYISNTMKPDMAKKEKTPKLPQVKEEMELDEETLQEMLNQPMYAKHVGHPKFKGMNYGQIAVKHGDKLPQVIKDLDKEGKELVKAKQTYKASALHDKAIRAFKSVHNKMNEEAVEEGLVKGTASLIKHTIGVPAKTAGRAAMGAVNAVHAVAGGIKNTVKDVKDASKKVKAAYAEQVVNEASTPEIKPADFHAWRQGKMTVDDVAKKYDTHTSRARSELNLHKDHWDQGEAHYNKIFKH